ncbi:MAG TPA: (Fe-S)-binding protein [Chloroflexi bacterium]|nr:(Fe-S)-binding protein [Chloroflexota bacterium]
MPLENVILTTENCRYCLMCRHVCPVGHVTRRESLTPHGWALMIASVGRGLLAWDEETVQALYSCSDCGTCRAHCVTDQPLPEAIAAARADVAARDLAPAVVYETHRALKEWGNPYEQQSPAPVEGQGEVALFVGDEARYLWPDALEAALKLLKAVGVEPVLIGVGRNNGYLASSLGFPSTARDLAGETLSELEATGATRLLVLGPGDFFTFSQLYDERLGIEWPSGVVLEEVVTFLAERLREGALAFRKAADGTPCAYVDPTHSVRVTTRYDAPRALLEAVLPAPARELFWRRERAHPCGNVALQFTEPHIARHLTYSRLADAAGVGARLVVTEDAGSLSHLARHAERFGLRVQGLYELLADHLA